MKKSCIFCGTTKKGKLKKGHKYFCEDTDCREKYREIKRREAEAGAIKKPGN